MVPKWVRSATDAPMHYSADGSKVWSDGTDFRIWDVATQTLTFCQAFGGLNGTLSNDGNGIYHGVSGPDRIYYYNISTKTRTLIFTDIAAYGLASKIAISADGTKFALRALNLNSNKSVIEVITGATGAVTRFIIPDQPAVAQLSFALNDTRVLTNGLRMYALNGSVVYTTSTAYANYTLSPDRTRVYCFDANDNMSAFSITGNGFTQLWTRAYGDTTPYDPMTISADGLALSTVSGSGGSNFIRSFRTSDGAQLSQGIVVTNTASYLSPLASSPTSNELLIFSSQGHSAIRRFSLNSGTGGGTSLPDLNEGKPYQGLKFWILCWYRWRSAI